MQKTLLALLIILNLTSIAQVKFFNGIIYDDYTSQHIKGVQVSPTFFDSIVLSNEKGRYKIQLPAKYRDTLVFTHPDYYPFVRRVHNGDFSKPQFIRLIPRAFKLDTVCYVAYNENMWLKGLVKDRNSEKPVINAEIRLENNKIIGYTDMVGKFEFALPRSNENLIIHHPDYKTSISNVKKNSPHNHNMVVRLDHKNALPKDSVSKGQNNIIVFVINELFTGSIGINYDRFIKYNHVVGINVSNYLFGFGHLPMFDQGTSNFKGIKLAPYYSYYFSRNMRKGAYVQGKAIGGYFDFKKLYYYYPSDSRYGEYQSPQFYSFGFGIGGGWYTVLPKMKHGIFKFYVGFQYFPMHVPETMESDKYGTLKVSKNWWYINGPGSYVEIKVSFGGIF